ncbi:hypothetical protein [Psychrobacter sp. MES7-P7E]|uniref:hypothetical protein n=1 Tax=Psychrobacter sp. MES7-P7E TaxID=2058322 RepID=UPI000C7F0F0D|nr:hypothetical protein [Psychrobacter sp. MES7-P7E]PLT21152.1 hypothetical protein CXF62_11675 [Psychrobacter sp. MES7-P7E]
MSRQVTGLPGIPKNIDRDMVMFLEAMKRAITDLSGNAGRNGVDADSRDYSLRLNSKSRKNIIDQINDVLVTLDNKLENSIVNSIQISEAKTANNLTEAKSQITQEISDAITANNITSTDAILLTVDQKISDNNNSLMVEIEALIDAKIAAQHPPPAP